MGLVAPWHVGSSQTRARTRVPCISRQILNHYATREAQSNYFYVKSYCYLELNCPTTQLLTIMMILTKLKVIQLLVLTSFPEYLYLFQSSVDFCQAMLLPER